MTRRIALISEHASPLGALGGVDSGGQNVYVGQVARHLAARGWEVDVFTRRDAETLPDVVTWEGGVRVVHVPAGPSCFVPKEELLPFMGAFTEHVLAAARDRRYDLLHANFWMSGLVAADVKRALDIPFAITFHALGRVRRLHQGEADRSPPERIAVEDRIVAEADQIVAECPRDEEDLVTLYGAAPAKITIVPCGFDPAEMAPIDRRLARLTLGLPLDEPIVLQLGRMVPRKGVDTVIEAFARLVDRYGWTRGRLLVVGGETDAPDPVATPEIGRLQALARQLGIVDRVTFVGRRGRSELRTYYSAADVFVTTPWYEPFGITPVEAMACGTPVVGADVGGIRFSVLDGETGYLVPPRDPDAVAERVARLVADPALNERFGQAAVARARRLFTWESVAASLETVYEDVLRERRRAVPDAAALALVEDGFVGAARTLDASRRALGPAVVAAARALTDCFARGNKVLTCGNGGSAADAQHLAAEFVGRFRPPARAALPAVALSADTVTLTAWANDASFDDVFARQVEAFGQPGDVLVAFSTSGGSPNVVAALDAARQRGLTTVALLGRGGGAALAHADIPLVVPADNTQHVQEAHLVMLHLLAELVDRAWQSGGPGHDGAVEAAPSRERRRNGRAAPEPRVAQESDVASPEPALAGGLVASGTANGHAGGDA